LRVSALVDRTETLKKIGDVKYFGYAIYEVEVSIGDTVTLAEFDSGVALKKGVLMNQKDGAEITCTVATNVVTVTGAATDETCVLFVFGVRAD
jgi:hypothetical protein